MRTSAFIFVVFVVIVALVLGGCSGGDGDVTPTPTQEPSPTPSPTPTKSPTPTLTPTPTPGPTPSVSITPIPTPTPTPTASNPTVESDSRIRINSIQLSADALTFSFIVYLPDGTVFLSRLYENGQEVSWWPTGQELVVKDQNIQITVKLGENGVPKPLPYRVHYYLTVWSKEDPSIIAGIGYFSPGPPPGS
jgi:hypothetical protein